jgi:hypothetical protein
MPPGISDTSYFPGASDSEEEKPVIEAFQGKLAFNGINAVTGEYAISPMSAHELASVIQGKPYEQISAEQKEIEQAHPEFKVLEEKQWQRLLDNIDEVRKSLLLDLSEEQAELLAKLFKSPWDYETLTETLTDLFTDLEKSRFIQLLNEQQDIFNTLVQESSDMLFSNMKPENKRILDAMIEEQQTLFDELKEAEECKLKQSINYGLLSTAAPTTPDVKDPADISQAGWGIIFPTVMPNEEREGIKKALGELLNLRREQAGSLFKIYEGSNGYCPGDTKSKFLQRRRVGPGLANPREMPFYILLIGSPEEIPYDFEDQLDVMRGVGRLDFGKDFEAYAQYAHNVVMAETGKVTLPRKATFFSVANPGDKATQLSARYLINELQSNLSDMAANLGEELEYDWDWDLIGNGNATHAQLGQLFSNAPAFLMTASHGMEFPKGHDNQFKYQGALLCQDWPGPKGHLKREHYFASEDLAEDANLLGMITLLFACYGAGTPRFDQFALQKGKTREEIAPEAFVADLPKQLLKHGALAVLGHVDRAWGYSFVKPSGEVDNAHFVIALRRLLNGQPVGLATDPGFDLRYADTSSELSSIMEELRFGNQKISDFELVQLWTANNDARGYAIIGDPAVRIPFAKDDEPTERPALETPEVPSFEAEKKELSSTIEPELFKASAAEKFGIREQVDDLTDSLREFTDQLAKSLEKAATDITTLEVKTYTTDDLSAVTAQSEGAARLRALTHIDFDGGMKVFVPQDRGGEVDRALWEVHLEMVREAQANRAQFLQAMAEMATNLLKSLK